MKCLGGLGLETTVGQWSVEPRIVLNRLSSSNFKSQWGLRQNTALHGGGWGVSPTSQSPELLPESAQKLKSSILRQLCMGVLQEKKGVLAFSPILSDVAGKPMTTWSQSTTSCAHLTFKNQPFSRPLKSVPSHPYPSSQWASELQSVSREQPSIRRLSLSKLKDSPLISWHS